MMMIPVHYIDELLRSFTVCDRVKGETVHQVFKKSPEEPTCQKSEQNGCITEIKPEMTQIDKIYNHRYIHPPNHQRVGLGEHFHITVTEKLGLPLVMNLFKLHFPQFK